MMKSNEERVKEWKTKFDNPIKTKLLAAVEIMAKAEIDRWWLDINALYYVYVTGSLGNNIDFSICFTGSDEEYKKLYDVLNNYSPDCKCRVVKHSNEYYNLEFTKIDNLTIYGLMDSYSTKGNSVNFIFYKSVQEEAKRFLQIQHHKYPEEMILPSIDDELEGVKIKVPFNQKEYLELIYGKGKFENKYEKK